MCFSSQPKSLESSQQPANQEPKNPIPNSPTRFGLQCWISSHIQETSIFPLSLPRKPRRKSGSSLLLQHNELRLPSLIHKNFLSEKPQYLVMTLREPRRHNVPPSPTFPCLAYYLKCFLFLHSNFIVPFPFSKNPVSLVGSFDLLEAICNADHLQLQAVTHTAAGMGCWRRTVVLNSSRSTSSTSAPWQEPGTVTTERPMTLPATSV